jgi:hypothetical protein
MSRIKIQTDDGLGWFDSTRAEIYSEVTSWDGDNQVSVATGNYAEHEALYHTAGGRWVLHHWSAWHGKPETYEFIDDDRAREWLILNEHDDAVAKHFGEIEEERGPGRPMIGGKVTIRLGDLLADVEMYQAGHGLTQAAALRQIVELGLLRAGLITPPDGVDVDELYQLGEHLPGSRELAQQINRRDALAREAAGLDDPAVGVHRKAAAATLARQAGNE